MTRLVLVRHGESVVTVNRLIGGLRTCTGLSPLGRKQASALAERLARTGEVTADVLVSSAYPRAIETAEIISPSLGDLPVVQVEGLGEHDPGPDCDGISFDEYVARYGPVDWSATDPYELGFEGGETVADFHHRVGTAMAALLRAHAGSTIVVVCHGGVIDRILRQALHAPPLGAFEIHTLNTSLTELVRTESGRWRLIRYNDCAHLEGLPTETPRTP
jgi:probable phosphoglycerate mutase